MTPLFDMRTIARIGYRATSVVLLYGTTRQVIWWSSAR